MSRTLNSLGRATIVFALGLSSLVALADDSVKKRAPSEWNPAVQGAFVVSICIDRDNRIWVGTEDMGVWRWDSNQAEDDVTKGVSKGKVPPGWTHYTRELTGGTPEKRGATVATYGTVQPFLGDDNAYALACDKQGRIWVGHLNHGVSVFNGERWANYDVLNGPLGERVFAIKVSPIDGDVWIATSLGLTRYRIATDSWTHYTRADGLPSDQIQCLAFAGDGTIYVGTQCDGLAIARPSKKEADDEAVLEYPEWEQITTPGNKDFLPFYPTGTGLPSRLINDVAVAPDGSVFAATSSGLAYSRDRGKNWEFIRGWDWGAKNKGRYTPPGALIESAAKDNWEENKEILLTEDYCVCLAVNPKGMLWIGHRDQRFEIVKSKDFTKIFRDDNFRVRDMDGYVRAVQPLLGQNWIVAKYGGGPKKLETPPLSYSRKFDPPKFPTPAKPLSVDDLNDLLAKLEKGSQDSPPSKCDANCFIGDDWTTWGDWVGRYGNRYNILCAVMTPLSHTLSWDTTNYSISAKIDPQFVEKKDGLRGWVHWLETRNPKTLYDPIIGVRRQAEWDDHGEICTKAQEGPNINIAIKVPEGTHRIAAYFINKDGHSTVNRYRDFILSLYRGEGSEAKRLGWARVHDFWGGVYKQFAVSEPGKYELRINRNYSHNAMVAGIFIDSLAGPQNPLDSLPLPWLGDIAYKAPPADAPDDDEEPETKLARKVWVAASLAKKDATQAAFCRMCQLQAYRTAMQTGISTNTLAAWRWNLGLWTEQERRSFAVTMDKGWDAQLEATPAIASKRKRHSLEDSSVTDKMLAAEKARADVRAKEANFSKQDSKSKKPAERSPFAK